MVVIFVEMNSPPQPPSLFFKERGACKIEKTEKYE
jgi:hypothetical protein